MEIQHYLQKNAAPAPKTYFPFSRVEGGLPQGGLVEISGAVGGGKLEALLRFLSENPSLQIAWLEEGRTTYPCAFPQHGVALDRVLFANTDSSLEAGSQLLTSAHLVLRSQIFQALVLIPNFEKFPHTATTHRFARSRDSRSQESRGREGDGSFSVFEEIELRRLQLAAEKSGTIIFLLSEKPSVAHTWPFAVQLQVSRSTPSLGDFRGELSVQVLKYRSQPRSEMSLSKSQALA